MKVWQALAASQGTSAADLAHDSNVTFAAKSEAFWMRQLPAIDQSSLDKLQERWTKLEAERQERERQAKIAL